MDKKEFTYNELIDNINDNVSYWKKVSLGYLTMGVIIGIIIGIIIGAN